jgi:hypothetical protein
VAGHRRLVTGRLLERSAVQLFGLTESDCHHQPCTYRNAPTTAAREVLHTLPITLISADQHFSVDAGEYSVEWSVAGGDTECHFAIAAMHLGGIAGDAQLIDTTAGLEPVNGTTDFTMVAGEYKLHQTNEPEDPCYREWSATIKAK